MTMLQGRDLRITHADRFCYCDVLDPCVLRLAVLYSPQNHELMQEEFEVRVGLECKDEAKNRTADGGSVRQHGVYRPYCFGETNITHQLLVLLGACIRNTCHYLLS